MWVRHTDGEPVQKLVDLYNSTHRRDRGGGVTRQNKIKLTGVPGEAFQQKVGAAAGANSPPGIVSSDVVYSPNYVKQSLYKDITEIANSLPFKDSSPNAADEVGSWFVKADAIVAVCISRRVVAPGVRHRRRA
jgi:multiple sugar transport system substrate-binding protein